MSFDGESERQLDKFQIHRANSLSRYTNFNNSAEISNSLQTYNWEDNARGVIQKYCPEMAEALTAQTEYALEMTCLHFGNQEVESTWPMRNSIVKYLMGIHGVRDSYFNYCAINKVLHKQHKSFTKKIMCDPNNITHNDFRDLCMLMPEERCHICILVMETKKQVELLFFTKALSQLINF